MLHGFLIASLILTPVPLARSVTIVGLTEDDGMGGTTSVQFEEWNSNGLRDGGEKYWAEDYADSDSEGLVDNREFVWLTSPGNPDSDYDGLTDGDEIDALGGPMMGFDPTNWDTDGDGYSDHDEAHGCYTVNYHSAGSGSSYYDWDGDTTKNPNDSDPFDPNLASDWNHNGTNDDQESNNTNTNSDRDGDGYFDDSDSTPDNSSLWNDWNHNNINDDQEGKRNGNGVRLQQLDKGVASRDRAQWHEAFASNQPEPITMLWPEATAERISSTTTTTADSSCILLGRLVK